RYNAACVAALAAAGQGEDAAGLNDEERAHLRARALNWLRADLAWWARALEGKAAEPMRQRARVVLAHWQGGTDLTALRQPEMLAKLPASEREAWRALWANVEKLLHRARE